MTLMNQPLENLASLLRERNAIDAKLSRLLDRPPEKGHIGEFIASRILNIRLEESASHKGSDGCFADGPLRGRSVDFKYTSKLDGLLNINPQAVPDFFLVLAGPRTPPGSSRGETRPFLIESVHLFDAGQVVEDLKARGRKIGIATSVLRATWEAAEIFPRERCPLLRLTPEQSMMFRLFGAV